MQIILFLILFPLIPALLLFFTKSLLIRKIITISSTILISLASLALLVQNINTDVVYFAIPSEFWQILIFIIEMLVAGYLIYASLKHKKYLALGLVFISTLVLLGFEIFSVHNLTVEYGLFLDKLSLIMALIVGIIGSLICIYSLNYMDHFHHAHPEIKDRSPFFFCIIFLFLSAMFGLIFSNNLLWLYFFWEITTLCSFLLIGYKENKESIDNAFKALTMNLLGGLAFIIGICVLFYFSGTVELHRMLAMSSGLVLIPAVLFSFAGLTKSAQLPFSSWLLGAMVAPTPVSALLHSSTMVKAGVYLILKMSPILHNTSYGFILAWIGGLTFLFTSFIAVAQQDAKKILAYSTIANLGLIVACAGMGSYEVVWAGVMLIVFHAIAKCLMFLCVGTVEENTSSRDVEDMDGLVVQLPQVAKMMLIGMAGMFIAPFGMLISKWAVLEAFIQENPFLALTIIFGSAPTLFFWVKWMGKLLSVPNEDPATTPKIDKGELFSLYSLAALTILVCAGFPLLSIFLVQPYVLHLYGVTVNIGQGNILIMLMMLGVVLLFPFGLHQSKTQKDVNIAAPYAGGANTVSFSFLGSAGQTHEIGLRNYYLEKFFAERVLLKWGIYITIGLLILLLGFGVISIWL